MKIQIKDNSDVPRITERTVHLQGWVVGEQRHHVWKI